MKLSTKLWLSNIALMVVGFATPTEYPQIWVPIVIVQFLCLIGQLVAHRKEWKQMRAEQEQELQEMLATIRSSYEQTSSTKG